jgi:hypothetical protein
MYVRQCKFVAPRAGKGGTLEEQVDGGGAAAAEGKGNERFCLWCERGTKQRFTLTSIYHLPMR